MLPNPWPACSPCRVRRSPLVVGRQMGDAVAALDAAEMALAHHHPGGAEMTGHRGPRRVVDEMDLSARLAGRDLVAELDEGLEQAGLRGMNVVVAILHLDDSRQR